MRSPWMIGAVALLWLSAAGVLASGPRNILLLWLLGLGVGAYVARWGGRSTQSGAPGSGREVSSIVGEASTAPGGGPETKLPLRALTAEEVAAALKVDIADVVHAIQAGRMPGNQVEGHWRCSEDSLRRWLDGSWATRDNRVG